MPSPLRENTPGLPNIGNGRRSRDPLPITVENIQNLVRQPKSIEQIASGLGLANYEAIIYLRAFLDEHFECRHSNTHVLYGPGLRFMEG